MKRLKIACIYPGGTARGVATVCESLVPALAARDEDQVTLVALHDPPNDGSNAECLDLPVDAPAACAGLHRWIHQCRPDVVLLNNVSMLEPYWRHFPIETAVIPVLHDDGRRYVRPVRRWHSSIDGVATVSNFIERQVRREIPEFDGMLGAIQNGCAYPAMPVRQETSPTIRLLFIGSGDLFKGAADLPGILRAVNELGVPVCLTVVGFSDSDFEARLSQSALAGQVRWVGRCPRERCLALAAENDLLVVPSRSESFGMATIEAMAMGCVPIAYDIPSGSREIIEPNRSGFLVPLGDFRGIAERIRQVHNDRTRLREMSEAAMIRARRDFSVESMAARYSSFIRNVIVGRLKRVPLREPFTGQVQRQPRSPYAMLPEGLRLSIRRSLGRSPKLSHAFRRLRF